ncbi:XdhC family protein [Streptomyces sp. TLI_185]|uniref:XdhC family protein n=1 Tax=Streptomyces sp. TLI_185 TaxID=2485151 RepID=UPI000F4ED2EA|nr:XdhC/CoxI family protein [Streptomyces sp. TLI_185]RPF36933.1 xanthine dehydrogenase accessory factor [Streptomyces sp. TLI_185]
MRELADTARQRAAQGRAAVLARPLSERGFGPRHPADAILVDEDGNCHGRLYRGAFDRQLVAEAASLPPGHTARVVAVAVHEDGVKEAGLTCGGQAEILLQPLAAVPARWWQLLGAGADAALVTWLDERRTHAVSTVVTLDGRADGPDVPPQAAASARDLLARHRAGREVHATEAGLCLVETCPAVPHLVIVGGGELAELLVAQAGLLGWQATVTSVARDAGALCAERQAAACLIMLSHEPDVDVPTLHAALTSGIPYVGALGSRHTQERRAAGLVEAGLDEEHLGRIHGPIGLDIGARTPAETAMAICAEVLAVLVAPRVAP